MSNNSHPIIHYLEIVAPILPIPIYWLDRNGVVLGANDAALKAIGCKSISEILGKTAFDFHSPEIAKHITQHDQQVIQTGETLQQEEPITDLSTGQTRYYKAVKTPLRDKKGNIIGLVGTSIELTAEKEAERSKLEEAKKTSIVKHLEILAAAFPTPVYWNDLDSRVLGVNEQVLKAAGAQSAIEFVGKTLEELYPKEIAKAIVAHNKKVIETGQMLSQEEQIQDVSTGQIKYFSAFKAPLRDDNGKIIGTLGTSIDITAEKEAQQREMEALKQAELLKFENETQKAVAQEQEKFSAIARKVAHDIASPLGALQTMLGLCDELPEDKRHSLRRASESILDIANSLIVNYQIDQPHHGIETEPHQSLLVSDFLGQILSEKKIQFRQQVIRFEISIAENAQFAFIRAQKSEFRRAISNLINNAVDALKEKKDKKVSVHLSATSHSVFIAIEDNGKGMPQKSVQNMERRHYFTEGKENGHGLGLQQVWDMLHENRGRLTVQSTEGEGTTVKLTFPRSAATKWIAQEMYLTPNQTIVILDDEQSIHDAWNMHFAPLLTTYPKLRLHHFTQGEKALNFINELTRPKKDNVMLLSDYELLHQPKNGLEIIQASHIPRSILVTSHYANPTVHKAASKLKIKILPKQMASIIPIHVG